MIVILNLIILLLFKNISFLSQNLKDLDCSNELVCFDDKGVVFPAFQKGREYNMKEYLALRKCRYLRLSKLNWESLQWQSKHQQLLDL